MTAQAFTSLISPVDHFSSLTLDGTLKRTAVASALVDFAYRRQRFTDPTKVWKTGVVFLGEYIVFYLPRVWPQQLVYKALKQHGLQTPTHYTDLQRCIPHAAPGSPLLDFPVWRSLIDQVYSDPAAVAPDAPPKDASLSTLSAIFKIVRDPGRSLRWDNAQVVADFPALYKATKRPEWLMVLTAYNHVMNYKLSPEFLHSVGIGWSRRTTNGHGDCVTRLVIQLPLLLAYLLNRPLPGHAFAVRTAEDKSHVDFIANNARSFADFYITVNNPDIRHRFADYEYKYAVSDKVAKSMMQRRIVVPLRYASVPEGAVASRYQLEPGAVPLEWLNSESYQYPVDDTVYIIPIENLHRDLPHWYAMSAQLDKQVAARKAAVRTVNGVRLHHRTVSHEFRTASGDAGVIHPTSAPITVKTHATAGWRQRSSATSGSPIWVSIPQELYQFIDPMLVVTFDPSSRAPHRDKRAGISVLDSATSTITATSLFNYLNAQYGEDRIKKFRLHTDEASQEVYFQINSRNDVRRTLTSGTVPNNTVIDQFMVFATALFDSPEKSNQALQRKVRAVKNVRVAGTNTITHEELTALRKILADARAMNAQDSTYSLDWTDRDWELVLNQEPFVSNKRTRKTVERFMVKYNRQVIREAVQLIGPTVEERLEYISKYRLYKYAPAVTKDVLKQFLIAYAASGRKLGEYSKVFRGDEFDRMLAAYQARMTKQERKFAEMAAQRQAQKLDIIFPPTT